MNDNTYCKFNNTLITGFIMLAIATFGLIVATVLSQGHLNSSSKVLNFITWFAGSSVALLVAADLMILSGFKSGRDQCADTRYEKGDWNMFIRMTFWFVGGLALIGLATISCLFSGLIIAMFINDSDGSFVRSGITLAIGGMGGLIAGEILVGIGIWGKLEKGDSVPVSCDQQVGIQTPATPPASTGGPVTPAATS